MQYLEFVLYSQLYRAELLRQAEQERLARQARAAGGRSVIARLIEPFGRRSAPRVAARPSEVARA